MPGGRPTHKDYSPLLTEALIDEMEIAITAGCYVETAAALVGISRTSFYKWLKIGAKTREGLEWKLVNTIQKALAQSELRDVLRIDKAVENGAWQAAAWKLERRFPDRWGRKDRHSIEHTGDGGGPIQIENMTSEEVKQKVIELSGNIVKKLEGPEEV